jgi:hypothetical protein
MKYAIIQSGVVANIAESETALADNWFEAGSAQIGWTHDGETFTPPPVPPAPVPASASPLQIRKALRQMDLKAAIDTFIAAQDEETQEAWEYAVQIDRDNSLIAQAAAVLEKTEADIDALFRLAVTL